VSHEVVVKLIATTKTRTGLRVKAQLDRRKYPPKIKVSEEDLRSVNLKRHEFHGDWNYTVSPSKE